MIRNIELTFWKVTIPLMTRSNTIRFIIKNCYNLYQDQTRVRQVATALIICCVGFAAGMLLFSLQLLLA